VTVAASARVATRRSRTAALGCHPRNPTKWCRRRWEHSTLRARDQRAEPGIQAEVVVGAPAVAARTLTVPARASEGAGRTVLEEAAVGGPVDGGDQEDPVVAASSVEGIAPPHQNDDREVLRHPAPRDGRLVHTGGRHPAAANAAVFEDDEGLALMARTVMGLLRVSA